MTAPVKINMYGHVQPSTFAEWVKRMQIVRGWDEFACAQYLGCGHNQIRIWSRGDVMAPPYIGLACAALANDLPPWKPGDKVKRVPRSWEK